MEMPQSFRFDAFHEGTPASQENILASLYKGVLARIEQENDIDVVTSTLEECDLETLLHMLLTSTGGKRIALLKALAVFAPHIPFEPIVDVLQHDEDWIVREEAVLLLGQLQAQAPLDTLILACKDEDLSVRAAALQALGMLGERVPFQPFLHALADPSALVRHAAIAALGTRGQLAPLTPLLQALSDESELVQEEARRTLMVIEMPAILQTLFRFYQETSGQAQDFAKQAWNACLQLALELVTPHTALDPILTMAQEPTHPSHKVVVYCLLAQAIQEIDARTSLVPLVAAFEELPSEQRTGLWSTLKALAVRLLEEHQQVDAIVAMSKEQDRAVRQEAEQALIELVDLALTVQKERMDTAPLIAALSSPDQERSEVAMRSLLPYALHALEEHRPLSPLIVALNHPEKQQRAAAAHALTQRTQQALQARRSPEEPMVVSWRDTQHEQSLAIQLGTSLRPSRNKAHPVLAWREHWQELIHEKPFIAHLAGALEGMSLQTLSTWN